MLKLKNKGFTLIELMVVIVIIGVLATLAIPRFTEASARAKVAEAPRVLASYESAFLASAAELAVNQITLDHLIFTVPQSKWFHYTAATGTHNCIGVASAKIGSFESGDRLVTTYSASLNASAGGFTRTSNNTTARTKFVPNFTSDL